MTDSWRARRVESAKRPSDVPTCDPRTFRRATLGRSDVRPSDVPTCDPRTFRRATLGRSDVRPSDVPTCDPRTFRRATLGRSDVRPSDVPTCDPRTFRRATLKRFDVGRFLKFQVSGPPAVLPHSRTKLRSRIGDIVCHSVGKVTPWGRVVQLSPRNLASCC